MADCYNAEPVKSWIESVDEAPHLHLPLFYAARDVLAQSHVARDSALSQACERWRYQLLSHHSGQIDATQQTLINILDLAANKLAGGPPRPPMQATRAVSSVGPTRIGGQSAEEWLASVDSRRALIRLATRLTDSPGDAFTEETADCPRRRRVELFAPIYLSSFCVNSCPYCWYRFSEQIRRRHLTAKEVGREADALADQGVRNVLLVAGDYPQQIDATYLCACASVIRSKGMTVRVEVAPLGTWDYKALADAGVQGVTLYQETYDRTRYAAYHPTGRKSRYEWRLETLDRAADAGMEHLGLGILLGLADPLQDLARLIEHGRYLASRYPTASLAFSLPRIHSAPSGFRIHYRVDDRTLVLLYSLLRVAFPSCQLVLSTRERSTLRNRLTKICVTRLSAGSKTSPGAYSGSDEEEKAAMQFPVADTRSISEVRNWLADHGL